MPRRTGADAKAKPGEGREIVYVREGETAYLNVDFDILSTAPLDSMVSAFGNSILTHHLGGERRRYEAHLSLASYPPTADAAIRRLAKLVERLPRPARRIWDQAHARVFNIGVQAGFEPRSWELLAGQAAMAAVARVGGSIGVTVYAAETTTANLLEDRAAES